GVDRRDALTGLIHCCKHDEGNERDEPSVLEQVLPTINANERAQTTRDKRHSDCWLVESLAKCRDSSAVCWRNWVGFPDLTLNDLASLLNCHLVWPSFERTMSRRTTRPATLLNGPLLAVLALPFSAAAQMTTGTIYGTITDQQGSMIPGATIVLTSETRGTKSDPVVTSTTGDYVIPN